jgi:hypothetical protein
MKISYKNMLEKVIKKQVMQISSLFFNSQIIWNEANSPILGTLRKNYV